MPYTSDHWIMEISVIRPPVSFRKEGRKRSVPGARSPQPLNRRGGGQEDVWQTFLHTFFFELEKRVSFDPALVLDVPHEMVERGEIAIDRRGFAAFGISP